MKERILKIGNYELIPIAEPTEGPQSKLVRADRIAYVDGFEVVRIQNGTPNRVGAIHLYSDARRGVLDFSWHPLDRGLEYSKHSRRTSASLLEAIEDIAGCPACLPYGATSKQVDAIKRYNQQLRSVMLGERDPEDTLDVGDHVKVTDDLGFSLNMRELIGMTGEVLRRHPEDNSVLVLFPESRSPTGIWMQRRSLKQLKRR
jgi:hypothetical protein